MSYVGDEHWIGPKNSQRGRTCWRLSPSRMGSSASCKIQIAALEAASEARGTAQDARQ